MTAASPEILTGAAAVKVGNMIFDAHVKKYPWLWEDAYASAKFNGGFAYLPIFGKIRQARKDEPSKSETLRFATKYICRINGIKIDECPSVAARVSKRVKRYDTRFFA